MRRSGLTVKKKTGKVDITDQMLLVQSITNETIEPFDRAKLAAGVLGLVILLQTQINPHLNLILLYGAPCALLALVVNARWATLFAVISAVASQLIRYDDAPDYHSLYVLVWNVATRLAVLESLVLILGRIRYEFAQNGDQVD